MKIRPKNTGANELTLERKEELTKAVKKTVKQYHKTLKLLAKT